MSNLECPICKSDSYLNPSIKIFISPCFHKICEQCMYKIFAHGYAPCPECGTQLRRINFISSTFEDIEVERDIRVRKFMNKSLKRERDDFQDSEEYNDYLEHYEDVVFELLEIDNDANIKERIGYLKSTDKVLCPLNKIGDTNVVEDQIKRAKIEEIKNWCVYSFDTLAEHKFDDESVIPNYLFKECEASGFTKRVMLDLIFYSLIN